MNTIRQKNIRLAILVCLTAFAYLQSVAWNDPFITVWEVTAEQGHLYFPGISGTYSQYHLRLEKKEAYGWYLKVDANFAIGSYTFYNLSPGIYRVKAYPNNFKGFKVRLVYNDEAKLIDIAQWGDVVWENLEEAFYGCSDLTMSATDAPNLSQVTDLSHMFYGCTSFNGYLTNWNTWHITNMDGMFQGATNFNGDISNWNTQNVTNMNQMFYEATAFNGDISNWNTQNVTDMTAMFMKATSFNQSIGSWNLSSLAHANEMFKDCNMPDTTYSKILRGWGFSWRTPHDIVFNSGLTYCSDPFVRKAHQNLVDKGWQMGDYKDNTLDPSPFVTIWELSGSQNYIKFPGISFGKYTLAIEQQQNGDWLILSATNTSGTCTFTGLSAGTYKISAYPSKLSFKGFRASALSKTDPKPVDIVQWGHVVWRELENAFYKCSDLTMSATDAPDLSQATNLFCMFYKATSFNGDISNWNTQGVTDMSGMLQGSKSFNQDISSWNLNSLTDADQMLKGTNISDSLYSKILREWASNPNTPEQIPFNSGLSYNSDSATVAAHEILVKKGWEMGDLKGGKPLPISLYAFSAKPASKGVLLEWVSLTEINNDYYSIYRSSDAENWELVQTVSGVGNSSAKQVYKLEDKQAYKGTVYYKLTQTDYDGTTEALGIRSVNLGKGFVKGLKVYPNPTKGMVNIRTEAVALQDVRLINSLGHNVTANVSLRALSNGEFSMDLSNLPAGVYFLSVSEQKIRVVKQ